MTQPFFLHLTSVLSVLLGLAGCSSLYDIQIANPIALERSDEMVGIPMDSLPKTKGAEFRIVNDDKEELPYQVTSDNILIFHATVHPGGTSTYKILKGKPLPADTLSCGAYRADRKDDLIWENDKSGYRTYGPALQADGDKAYGYDVFTKSVACPVMKARFDSALYSRSRPSFHLDHGNGMDSYGVGPTLGCGATALIVNDVVYYPRSWTKFAILDNGPLRFRMKLDYYPVVLADGRTVVETRTITLDAGSYLNKAEVTYSVADSASVAVGIVVHKENPVAYRMNQDKGYMAYADLGDRNVGQNGEIYCGVVLPEKTDTLGFRAFPEEISGAVGHLWATSELKKDTTFDYYFGSGWSKGGVKSLDSWAEYLNEYSNKVRNPLKITITK